MKVWVDPEMNLHWAACEPASTALLQFGGLVDFGHSKQAGVERARLIFHAGGHGELHVVNRDERGHGQFSVKLAENSTTMGSVLADWG